MGFLKLSTTKRRIAVIAIILVLLVAWLGYSLFQGRGQPTVVPNRDQAPTLVANKQPDGSFADADSKFKELFQRQQVLSQQAAEIAALQQSGGVSGSGVSGEQASIASGKSSQPDIQRQKFEKLMAERDAAVSEIMKAGPGDTKKIIGAMEKLDAQMREAGMPSIIDMPKFRQMIIGADRLQEISKRLQEESQKGQQADAARIQSLLKELAAVQAAMPRTPYDTAALEKVMKSGR